MVNTNNAIWSQSLTIKLTKMVNRTLTKMVTCRFTIMVNHRNTYWPYLIPRLELQVNHIGEL